jgi:hypothetical protein
LSRERQPSVGIQDRIAKELSDPRFKAMCAGFLAALVRFSGQRLSCSSPHIHSSINRSSLGGGAEIFFHNHSGP